MTYILLTIGSRPLIRPESYQYYYEVHGAEIHAVGSKELCLEYQKLL